MVCVRERHSEASALAGIYICRRRRREADKQAGRQQAKHARFARQTRTDEHGGGLHALHGVGAEHVELARVERLVDLLVLRLQICVHRF